MRAVWIVLVSSLAALAPLSAAAQPLPDAVSSLPWIVRGGVVTAAHQVGDRLYLGGTFTSIARPRDDIGPVGVFSTDTAELLAADPALSSASPHAVIADGAGGWFLAGEFQIDGEARGMIHLDAAGRRLPWAVESGPVGPDSRGGITTLARVGGTLLVGGAFSTVSGAARVNLAAVDIATQTVLPVDFGIVGSGVGALHVAGNSLYVAAGSRVPEDKRAAIWRPSTSAPARCPPGRQMLDRRRRRWIRTGRARWCTPSRRMARWCSWVARSPR